MNNVFSKYTDLETFNKINDYTCMNQMWVDAVENYGNNVCVFDKTEYTYNDLDNSVGNFRSILKQKGIKPGDIVAMYLPNCIDFVKAYLAITTLGACAILLPPHLDGNTVFGATRFGVKALVFDSSLEENLSVVKTNNKDLVLINGAETCTDYTPGIDCSGERLCTILFTGGTTGKSKGAKLSHQAVQEGIKNGCYGYKNVFEQRYFLVLPLTHVFGLIRNLLTTIRTGSSIYICRNNKDMFREIAVFRPTIMVFVPALAEMALNLSKQFGKNMLGEDMKTIICGAAAVPPYLIKEYDKLGIQLLPGYGLTESANLVSGNPEALKKPDSVGIIYPGIDYKIVNDELWLKGKTMMDGYLGDGNAESYSPDGYFKTGDLVRIDDEGFLYIIGRSKEVIVLSSGENVSPAELEKYFYDLDAVQDCLVYSEKIDNREILTVEILPRATAIKALEISDIEAYMKEKLVEINEKLPSYERINKVIIRTNDFKRSPSMKILRGQNG